MLYELRLSNDWCNRINRLRHYNGLGTLTRQTLLEKVMEAKNRPPEELMSELFGLTVVRRQTGILCIPLEHMPRERIQAIASLIEVGHELEISWRIKYRGRQISAIVVPASLRKPFEQAINIAEKAARDSPKT